MFSGTGGETREGWTTGVGIEYAFTNSLSFKAEYDYMNFGSRTATINGTAGGLRPFSAGIQNNLHDQRGEGRPEFPCHAQFLVVSDA